MAEIRPEQRSWGRGRSRPTQDVVRSFSAPHPTKINRQKVLPVRSLSATEQKLNDMYDYCEVTSPSEEEYETDMNRAIPQKAEVPVGPAKRVVASLIPGSGLQRVHMRGPVRSYNPRVRDLARDTQNIHWIEDDLIGMCCIHLVI